MYPGIGVTAETNPLVNFSKWGSEEDYQLYLTCKKLGWDWMALIPLFAGLEKAANKLPKRNRR